MIPSYYVRIEQIPLLQSGKLDRKSLPMHEKTAELTEYAATVTDTQKILCAVFEKVLGIEKVGIHDNFYQIGGDSLGAMSVLAEADLDELSAIDIFEGCTPEGIAAIYERKLREAGEDDPEVTEMRERSRTHIPTANQILLIDYQLFHPKRISLDLPQGIMVNLGLASSLFSAEKTELIKQTMEGIIQNMIGADLTS